MGVYAPLYEKDKKKKQPTITPTITPNIPRYENYVDNVVSGAYGTGSGSGSGSGSSEGTGNTGASPAASQGYYQKMIENYEKQRQDSINQAEAQRGRSLREAEGLYSRSLATYGQNAEKMSQMGLTGSGYSDYIRSAAAAQRAAGGLAADATYNSAVKEANNTYNDKENALKQESYLAWLEAREGAIDGTLNKDKLDLYAEHYGFTEEQKTGLESTLKETETKATLDNISNGIIDFTAIADKYKGNESSGEYLNVKAEVNKNVDTGTSFFKDETGNQMSYSAAQKQYQAAIDSGIFDDSKLKEIKATLDRDYKVVYNAGLAASTVNAFIADPNMSFEDSREIVGEFGSVENQDMSVRLPDGTKLRLAINLRKAQELNVSANNGEVVKHDGKIYIKYCDKFFELIARGNTYKSHYQQLQDYFFN